MGHAKTESGQVPIIALCVAIRNKKKDLCFNTGVIAELLMFYFLQHFIDFVAKRPETTTENRYCIFFKKMS